MEEVGKLLIYAGVFLAIVGVFVIGISKLGSSIPIGKLPGDIYIKRENFVFYFPLGTSILISLIFFFSYFCSISINEEISYENFVITTFSFTSSDKNLFSSNRKNRNYRFEMD
ncbi:DUF2905 domain-containing protein [Desulfurobacterium thermolithotrophum]|uniref:DUF2905 domain-containing protein n=1 Tax=Desulfurobacterium thermolithotrophum TaxID=64160 RepID=UPI000A007C0E|nr:DUF2905 domain-containing protein [Desulfurobacterium thermolithotrophum]